MTPRGLLQWQITLRDDGQRLFAGALPTLIEWGDTHPAPSMPESGVTLQSLVVSHPQAAPLQAACEAIGLERVKVKEGEANLCATLLTPRGRVQLNRKVCDAIRAPRSRGRTPDGARGHAPHPAISPGRCCASGSA
jgi:hypothetical protein